MQRNQHICSCTSKKEKESHYCNIPGHVHAALRKWACVTKEKTCSALCYNPHNKAYWSNRQRIVYLGWVKHNAFTTKSTGFSMCHPIHDDHIMLKLMQHATYSATQDQLLPTSTFLFLPNWANRSINPYMRVFHGGLGFRV